VVSLNRQELLGLFDIKESDYSRTSLGIFIIDSAVGNNSIKWFFDNFMVGRPYHRDSVVNMLSYSVLNTRESVALVNRTFKKLSSGVVLKHQFSIVEDNFLVRLACPLRHTDELVYGLYRYADCVGTMEFRLSELFSVDGHVTAINPFNIFGIDIDGARRILRGISAVSPELVYASFTHDLEMVSLSRSLSSFDILRAIKNNCLVK